jgi:hypothetical protein
MWMLRDVQAIMQDLGCGAKLYISYISGCK